MELKERLGILMTLFSRCRIKHKAATCHECNLYFNDYNDGFVDALEELSSKSNLLIENKYQLFLGVLLIRLISRENLVKQVWLNPNISLKLSQRTENALHGILGENLQALKSILRKR